MRAFVLRIAAAAAALMGAAEARTVQLGEILAAGGAIDLDGARAEIIPAVAEISMSRSEMRDAGFLLCEGPRGSHCRSRAITSSPGTDAMLAIYLDEGMSLSKLSFVNHFGGEATVGGLTVSINGIAYAIRDLSELVLTGQRVIINLDDAAAQRLSLRSFEISAFDTPLPAAGFLMILGIGGIALANRARKLR
jgi:hypothetical protein